MVGFTVPTLDDKAVEKVAPQPQSIIIHQTLPGSDQNKIVTLVVKVVVGGSACWLGYMVLTNALPEYMQEFFPVTRKYFAKTSKFLVSSIEQVKNVLEEQINAVIGKQDDLSKKLDGTNESVEGLHKKLGYAQSDLDRLNASMGRQEDILSASHKTMSYTSKGVTLLVRCVASMLPTNDRTVHDLAEYVKDGEEIKKHEEKQEQQRRIQNSTMKTPLSSSMLSPTGRMMPTPQNLMIRESRADSDMDSLEDVHSVLGIKPGQALVMT